MVLNKGGYVIINKALNNVYELAYNALISGKPILWYENYTTCYYIDTITLSGTDVVLTKGGKTILIEIDGTITETGDIQPHLYQFCIYYKLLVDSRLNYYNPHHFLYIWFFLLYLHQQCIALSY